jgi:hypothetical protein
VLRRSSEEIKEMLGRIMLKVRSLFDDEFKSRQKGEDAILYISTS